VNKAKGRGLDNSGKLDICGTVILYTMPGTVGSHGDLVQSFSDYSAATTVTIMHAPYVVVVRATSATGLHGGPPNSSTYRAISETPRLCKSPARRKPYYETRRAPREWPRPADGDDVPPAPIGNLRRSQGVHREIPHNDRSGAYLALRNGGTFEP